MTAAPYDNEEEFLSLCARYPEITFDSYIESDQTPSEQIQSSPLSATEKDEGETSQLSDTTAHTTPLRGQLTVIGRLSGVDTLSGFLRLVRESDLDEGCSQIFVGLGYAVATLAQAVFPSNRLFGIQNQTYHILQLCHSLLLPISEASTRIDSHIQKIVRLKSLVAFTTPPTDPYLWSVYRQRAQLIIRFAALPSTSENRLICALAQLFNTQIYRPFLDIANEDVYEDSTIKALNRLYDTIMTWQERYRDWCDHMKDLRYKYMLPLLKRIHASPQILQEVRDVHVAKAAANDMITRPGARGTLPAEENVIRALALSARRRGGNAKQLRTRMRREHTV